MKPISEEEKSIFRGEQVYLAAVDPEADASLFARWMQDAEFVRLMDTDPPKLMSLGKHKEWLEKELLEERTNNDLFFLIMTVQDDRKIGLIGLDGIRWEHGDAWVGIGLGERAYWGEGYGTDAMRVIQRYAFEELNLHRLSLSVFEYNSRAVRSYEKAGFTMEGSARKFLHREDMRYDLVFMGILRDEWERMTSKK
jgi:RimJ/RimL family protein N-acetyltransferase